MAKSKKPKKVDEFTYKNCKVQTDHFDVDQVLKIDKKEVPVDRDADTGAYVSREAPYQSFGTLDELAKAVIDCR